MPEQEHEYHPGVEEVVHTSGPDIGRLKDTDTAREVAYTEKNWRDRGLSNLDEVADRFTKAEIGGKGAEEAALKAARYIGYDEENMNAAVPGAGEASMRREAKAAVESYEQLKKDIPDKLRDELARAQDKNKSEGDKER